VGREYPTGILPKWGVFKYKPYVIVARVGKLTTMRKKRGGRRGGRDRFIRKKYHVTQSEGKSCQLSKRPGPAKEGTPIRKTQH